MSLSRLALCVVVVVLAVGRGVRAEGEAEERGAAEHLGEVLASLGAPLGMEFTPAAAGVFAAQVERGLANCSAIDVEVRVGEEETLEVLAWPRVRGERIDPRKAVDADAFPRALEASGSGLAPFAWATDARSCLHARARIAGDAAQVAAELERLLRAVAQVDVAVATLLPALGVVPVLAPEQLAARLREAAAADQAQRGVILAEIASSLPTMAVSDTPGKSAFSKLVLNTHGAAFDAFRFRVPAEGGDRRLVWAFAYPPGTAKGWFIVPVSGDAPQFKRFHQAPRLAGTGVPEGHAVLLQRTETPLRPGAEYVLWFQFKVETPVEMWFALGCFPFASTDGSAPDALMGALGLERAP